MKSFFVFLVFLILGILVGLGYRSYFKNKIIPSVNNPLPSEAFSIDTPPKDSLKGIVSQMSGDVFWESRVATSPALINKLEMVQQGEEIQTGDDGKITWDFPNLLSVDVAKNSDVSLIQTLPTNLVLEQKDGQITYKKIGASPVSIRALHLLISVETGQIKVIFSKKKDQVEVDTENGTAKVGYEDQNNISQVVELDKNKQFLFDDESRTGEFIGG